MEEEDRIDAVMPCVFMLQITPETQCWRDVVCARCRVCLTQKAQEVVFAMAVRIQRRTQPITATGIIAHDITITDALICMSCLRAVGAAFFVRATVDAMTHLKGLFRAQFAKVRHLFTPHESTCRELWDYVLRIMNSEHHSIAQILGLMINTCAACGGKQTSIECAGCAFMRYCSSACQERHWNDKHDTECAMISKHSFYYSDPTHFF